MKRRNFLLATPAAALGTLVLPSTSLSAPAIITNTSQSLPRHTKGRMGLAV